MLDGGWCKRTHKHSYNAKYGVAIIIGLATGKILHMGVSNKYCSICASAQMIGQSTTEHHCHKNREGPSSSMETNIVVEGFKQAETKYGLWYTTFVGDGDRSVYPSLICAVPSSGHAIRKLECANHAIKCYRAALEKLVQHNPKYQGKGKLTVVLRKRLTAAAHCAIKMGSKESDKNKEAELLHQDLRNSPLHCFGVHTNCSTHYCKVAQETANSQSVESYNSPSTSSTSTV